MTGPTLETAEGAGAGERQHVLILKGRFQPFFSDPDPGLDLLTDVGGEAQATGAAL